MKSTNTINDGYILVMTLLIIALATLMTTIMFNRGSSYIPYVQTVIDRQKSIMLAFGGLALAESQLLHSIIATEQKKSGEEPKKPEKPTEVQETQQLLRTLLPTLNQWQIFTLNEDLDGVEGVLKICIMSEDGKINLNQAYDFKAKKFKGEAQQNGGIKAALIPIFAELEKMVQAKNLLQGLEQFLQKRGYPLNDVTELLTIKGFEAFKHAVYYTPAAPTKTKEKETKRIGDLTDLFTINSSEENVDPWLLSESLRTLLNIPQSVASSDSKRTETVAEILKQFKLKAQWQNEWDTFLKPLYGIEFSRLPKYASVVLRSSCKPRYFSVLIHSTVGDVTQRLYVILERIQKSQDTKTVYKIVVRSYYWL